jgi:hypothetical protein
VREFGYLCSYGSAQSAFIAQNHKNFVFNGKILSKSVVIPQTITIFVVRYARVRVANSERQNKLFTNIHKS